MIKIETASINDELKQIRHHSRKVIQIIRNGILSAIPFILPGTSFKDKIKKEYRVYLLSLKAMSKQEIINHAEQITYINKIYETLKSIFEDNKSSLGLFCTRNTLLLELYSKLVNDENSDFSEEYIKDVICDFAHELQNDRELCELCISPFLKEYSAKNSDKSSGMAFNITLTETGEKDITFTLPIDDLYNYLDPAILAKFSERQMCDFPAANYFGDEYEEIYSKICMIRFCRRFKKNLKSNYVIGENNGIIRLNSEICGFNENSFEGLQNRVALVRFIKRNYVSSDKAIKFISLYHEKNIEILDEFKNMLGGTK